MYTYIFYTKNDKGQTIRTYTKICKRPTATKLYKQLLKALDNNKEIHSIGYSIANEFR